VRPSFLKAYEMALNETSVVNPGDIYWITIPTRGGREQEGRRPCIVMSRLTVNQGNPVVVVPMTTNLSKANAYNIKIPAQEIVRDIASTSVIQDSVALCGQCFAIDKRKFEDKIGKLSQLAIIAVQLGLSYLFDIR
jgi:mRNA-degrading endonuclease toxin of MazEF toxin-antitoxin module